MADELTDKINTLVAAATIEVWEEAKTLVRERLAGAKWQRDEIVTAMQVRINALKKAGT